MGNHWGLPVGTPVAIPPRITMSARIPKKPAMTLEGALAAFVEACPDAVLTATLDGRITLWNPAAEKLFEYSATEALGQPTTITVPEELHGEHSEVLRRIAEGEAVTRETAIGVAKGGRRLDLLLSASPVRDVTGAITGVLQIARDITERRRGAVEQARLAAIVD